MRKLLLIVCAVLIGASLVGIQRAEAATYVSMLSSGTSAAWLECEYDTAPVSGYYNYDYTLYLHDISGYSLPSGYSYYADLWALKVINASKNPVIWVSSPVDGVGTPPEVATWDFSQGFGYSDYMWTAQIVGQGRDWMLATEELNHMKVKSTFSPTYVAAAVWNGGTPTASGTTIGPAPEPASLSLLGLSLLGLGGAMFRKKFKA